MNPVVPSCCDTGDICTYCMSIRNILLMFLLISCNFQSIVSLIASILVEDSRVALL
jgi:hypothetical protein